MYSPKSARSYVKPSTSVYHSSHKMQTMGYTNICQTRHEHMSRHSQAAIGAHTDTRPHRFKHLQPRCHPFRPNNTHAALVTSKDFTRPVQTFTEGILNASLGRSKHVSSDQQILGNIDSNTDYRGYKRNKPAALRRDTGLTLK